MNPGRMITQGGPKLVSTIGLLHTPDPPGTGLEREGQEQIGERQTFARFPPSVCPCWLILISYLQLDKSQDQDRIEAKVQHLLPASVVIFYQIFGTKDTDWGIE